MAIKFAAVLSHDAEQDRKTAEYIVHHRSWFISLGAALIALGLIAAGSALTTTYVSMLFLSFVLLVGGIMRIVAAFSTREWAGSLLLALSGALYIVIGVLTFRHPVAAALALSLVFAALLVGVGLFRLITSIWYRFPDWGWVALGGGVSVLLGLMVWHAWPVSGLWFIGFCVGIDLIVEGSGWIKLALGSNTARSESPRSGATSAEVSRGI